MNIDELKIRGTDTDDVDEAGYMEVTMYVAGVEPSFEKSGEDVETVGGGIKATRFENLLFNVKYAPILIEPEAEGSPYNSYLNFLTLKQVLLKKYIWFYDTGLNRKFDAGSFWDLILPIKVEKIEESKSPQFESGSEDFSQTFRTREHVDITELFTLLDAPAGLAFHEGINLTFIFTWNAVEGATSYELAQSQDNGTTWVTISTIAATSTTFTPGAGSHKFRVRAKNSTGGASAWSTAIDYLRAGTLGKVMNPTLIFNDDTDYITYSWDTVDGADTYYIVSCEVDLGAPANSFITHGLNDNPPLVTFAWNSRRYYFYCIACVIIEEIEYIRGIQSDIIYIDTDPYN
jgi:hypothetical protein